MIQVCEVFPYPCDANWTAQDESEFRLKWRSEGIDVYNPALLPAIPVGGPKENEPEDKESEEN